MTLNLLDEQDNQILFTKGEHHTYFNWREFIIVLIFSSITSFLVLRVTLLSPGFIFIRDTTPIFYNSRIACTSGFNNASNLIGFMDLSGYPLLSLFISRLINLQMFQKLSYFLFPFFLGQISLYYSIRYFVKNYISQFQNNIGKSWFIFPALVISFIYVIEPIPSYFSFWTYFSAFIVFAPALIAAADFAFRDIPSRNDAIKRSLLLSLIWALSIADPRTFVYSSLIVIAILLFRLFTSSGKRLMVFMAFIVTLFLLLCIESRVIYVVYIGLKTNYLNIASNINSEQKWGLTYFFSLKDVIRGTAVYWGWVSYSSLSALAFIPFVIVVLYILLKKNEKFLVFLFFCLALIMLIVSNTLSIGLIFSHIINTYVQNYIYIFFPMYLISLIPPFMIILFSLGIFSLINLTINLKNGKRFFIKIKRKIFKITIFTIIILILFSQLAFAYPTYATGNYDGLYNPINIPHSMVNAGIFLENSSGYNAIVAPTVQYPPPANVWNSTSSLMQSLSAYKNAIVIPSSSACNEEFLSHLYYLGIQHLVIVDIYNNYQAIIDRATNSSALILSFSQGFIFIFTVKAFEQKLTSHGLFLDFNYPSSSIILDQWNSTLVNLPYFGQNIPTKYVNGIIAINISLLDFLALFTSNYSLDLFNLVGRYSSNPSSPGSNWGYDISYFPVGADGIGINGEYNRTIRFSQQTGKYIILVDGLTFQPPNRNDYHYSFISFSSGNNTLVANFTSLALPYYQCAKWINAGCIDSNGSIFLENHGPLYITSIRLIPLNQYKVLRNKAVLYANNVSVISGEPSENTLSNIISNYTVAENTTMYEYPYLAFHVIPSTANIVTLLVHPSSNTFGVPDQILQSLNLTFTNYYIDTTYYYIVLGSHYNFKEVGYVNPIFIVILNASTIILSIMIIQILLSRPSKKLRHIRDR